MTLFRLAASCSLYLLSVIRSQIIIYFILILARLLFIHLWRNLNFMLRCGFHLSQIQLFSQKDCNTFLFYFCTLFYLQSYHSVCVVTVRSESKRMPNEHVLTCAFIGVHVPINLDFFNIFGLFSCWAIPFLKVGTAWFWRCVVTFMKMTYCS